MFNLKIIPLDWGNDNIRKIAWYNLDTKTHHAGTFDYGTKNGTAWIIGYMKDKKQKNIKGVGYELIKMSIDYLLEQGLHVGSQHRSRSEAANKVWDKLKKEYVVIETTTSWNSDAYLLTGKK